MIVTFILSLITISILFYVVRTRYREENFDNPTANPGKPAKVDPGKLAAEILSTSLRQLKKATRHVLDPVAFKERMMMASMSPIELARKYIKETSKK
jgi:hypothetical protein